MAPEIIKIDEKQKILMFAASCIEWVADKLECDYQDIFNRMDKVGLIERYIMKCYDVLHLESRDNITEDLIQTLNIWENNLIEK
ncbi:MAG: DUF3791 domain-containing protein [Muribaculaceae bacterium]|nr:DUF3791 domain-containing protein [Muribaculaceae bacterium]